MIPSDPFQGLPIFSFEIFSDAFSDGYDSGEKDNVLPIRLSVHRVGGGDSSELDQENGFESSPWPLLFFQILQNGRAGGERLA